MQQKIALFVHCFPPAQGGLEKLTGDMTNRWRQEGRQIDIFTGRGRTLDSYKTFSDYVDASRDPEYVHRLDLHKYWQRITNRLFYPLVLKFSLVSPWYFGPILRYERKHEVIIQDADLIMGFGLPTKMVWDAYTYAKRYGKKLQILPAYHDVGYYNNCPAFHEVFMYAEKVLTLSDFEEEALVRNYPECKGKIERLEYWPFNEEQMKRRLEILARLSTTREARKRKGIVHLGFVGQITPRKNLIYFQRLLDNIEKYPEYKDKQVLITLAGIHTNGSSEVERQLEKGINQGKIKIIYDFKERDRETIYGNIDVFINPSKEESLGIVNFEAEYYGCYVAKIDMSI